MLNYRHERLPNSPVASNPNARSNYDRLDAEHLHRERGHCSPDSDDPWVRRQHLGDNRLIGNNPTPPPDGGNHTAPDPEHAANIHRWEIALGLRHDRSARHRRGLGVGNTRGWAAEGGRSVNFVNFAPVRL